MCWCHRVAEESLRLVLLVRPCNRSPSLQVFSSFSVDDTSLAVCCPFTSSYPPLLCGSASCCLALLVRTTTVSRKLSSAPHTKTTCTPRNLHAHTHTKGVMVWVLDQGWAKNQDHPGSEQHHLLLQCVFTENVRNRCLVTADDDEVTLNSVTFLPSFTSSLFASCLWFLVSHNPPRLPH